MGNLYKKSEPPKDLRERIISGIALDRKRTAEKRAIAFGSFAAILVAASVPIGIDAASAFTRSGFFGYLSLAFSDSSIILSSLADFMIVLMESLPMTEIISTVTIITLALWSAAITAKNLSEIKPMRAIVNK